MARHELRRGSDGITESFLDEGRLGLKEFEIGERVGDEEPSTVLVFGGFCEGDRTTGLVAQNIQEVWGQAHDDLLGSDSDSGPVPRPLRVVVINPRDYQQLRDFEYSGDGRPLLEYGQSLFGRIRGGDPESGVDGLSALDTGGGVLILDNSLGRLVSEGLMTEAVDNRATIIGHYSMMPAGEQKRKRGLGSIRQKARMVGGLVLDSLQETVSARNKEICRRNRRIALNLGGVMTRALIRSKLIKRPGLLWGILNELPAMKGDQPLTRGVGRSKAFIGEYDDAFPPDERVETGREIQAILSNHNSLAANTPEVRQALASIYGDIQETLASAAWS